MRGYERASDRQSGRCGVIKPERRALYAALFKLPERDRMLVCYKYLMGLNYHEIAVKFQMNESTLASALLRARSKLREELDIWLVDHLCNYVT